MIRGGHDGGSEEEEGEGERRRSLTHPQQLRDVIRAPTLASPLLPPSHQAWHSTAVLATLVTPLAGVNAAAGGLAIGSVWDATL